MNPIELTQIQYGEPIHKITYMPYCDSHIYWNVRFPKVEEHCNLYLYTNGPTRAIPNWTDDGILFTQIHRPQFTHGDGTYKFFLSTGEEQLGKYVIVIPKPIDAQLHEAIQQFNVVHGCVRSILTI